MCAPPDSAERPADSPQGKATTDEDVPNKRYDEA